MKPILLDLPMPITMSRILLRSPQLGDGVALNAAVLESFDNIRYTLCHGLKKKPSLEESEEFVRQAAANWILKTLGVFNGRRINKKNPLFIRG